MPSTIRAPTGDQNTYTAKKIALISDTSNIAAPNVGMLRHLVRPVFPALITSPTPNSSHDIRISGEGSSVSSQPRLPTSSTATREPVNRSVSLTNGTTSNG